ncbi:hypothetical protein Bca101_010493 [Brassica carinata]
MKRSGLVSSRLSSVNSPRSRGVPLPSGVRHQWGFGSWPQHQPPTLVSSSRVGEFSISFEFPVDSPLAENGVICVDPYQNFCLAGNPIVGYGQSVMDDFYRRLYQINALTVCRSAELEAQFGIVEALLKDRDGRIKKLETYVPALLAQLKSLQDSLSASGVADGVDILVDQQESDQPSSKRIKHLKASSFISVGKR